MAIFMEHVTVELKSGEKQRFDDVRTVLEEDGTLTLERDGKEDVVFKPAEYVRYYPSKYE